MTVSTDKEGASIQMPTKSTFSLSLFKGKGVNLRVRVEDHLLVGEVTFT